MRHLIFLLPLLLLFTAAAPQSTDSSQSTESPQKADGNIRFEAIDVYIDSGTQALSAYQLTLTAKGGQMKVVGVENGEHPAFAKAPYFDRKAVQQGKADKIIVAAFHTGAAKDLPKGRTRVTTIHVQTNGAQDLTYEVKLKVAATVNEKKIEAKISFEKGTGK